MFTKTLSDEGMTKIKVVDLDEYYNFYVNDFLSRKHLVCKLILFYFNLFLRLTLADN